MGHYYDENPDVQSDERVIQYHYHSHQLNLTTDAGVFSKAQVDFGSDTLVQTFLNEHPPGPSKTIADVGWVWSDRINDCKVSPHHQITMVDVNKRALNLAEKNKKQIKLITSLSKKVMVYHN